MVWLVVILVVVGFAALAVLLLSLCGIKSNADDLSEQENGADVDEVAA